MWKPRKAEQLPKKAGQWPIWFYTPVTPMIGRLRQGDFDKFYTNLELQ